MRGTMIDARVRGVLVLMVAAHHGKVKEEMATDKHRCTRIRGNDTQDAGLRLRTRWKSKSRDAVGNLAGAELGRRTGRLLA